MHMKEKRINVYIPSEIDAQLRQMEGTVKNNVCTILAQYFAQENPEYAQPLHIDVQDISDDVFSEIYNNFYNMELYPKEIENRYLKKYIIDLKERITDFKTNESYFKQQVNALMLAKMPWLARLKMKFLQSRER